MSELTELKRPTKKPEIIVSAIFHELINKANFLIRIFIQSKEQDTKTFFKVFKTA